MRGGIESPDAEARWIVEAAGPGEGSRQVAISLAERRANGEPLQYLTGVAGFRTIELRVGPGVFIPRPETEIVTETALELLPRAGTLVDIGTGSGAIALAVGAERLDARVLATEISKDAFSWATANRDELGSDVTMLLGDLYEPLAEELSGAIDVIVSNPPYIARSEASTLPADVRDHEPAIALFAQSDGMRMIERITEGANRWLRPGGYLVLEIGATQAEAVAIVLREGNFEQVEIRPDLVGRDRVAIGRRS